MLLWLSHVCRLPEMGTLSEKFSLVNAPHKTYNWFNFSFFKRLQAIFLRVLLMVFTAFSHNRCVLQLPPPLPRCFFLSYCMHPLWCYCMSVVLDIIQGEVSEGVSGNMQSSNFRSNALCLQQLQSLEVFIMNASSPCQYHSLSLYYIAF